MMKYSPLKTLSLLFILQLAYGNCFGQQTPPMGWNSWNEFGVKVSEDLIMEVCDSMKAYKLDECGYKYIVIDDGWQAKELGDNGMLEASPEKFPAGMLNLSNYLNCKGFELGIYSSPNIRTCADFPGSLALETRHAWQFAQWGAKFLKYDYCPTRNGEQGSAPDTILARLKNMKSALDEADPDIIYAICEKGWYGGQIKNARKFRTQRSISSQNRYELFEWAPELGTMWRTTMDIRPNWEKIMQILDEQDGLARLSGPGSFNDPDMLEVGNGDLSLAENRAHFSLWCLLAAPLFLGNDVRNIPDDVLSIITNKEVIALNQDKLCKQAIKVSETDSVEVFLKPLLDGDWGICILNRNERPKQLKFTWDDFDIHPESLASVRDLWKHKNIKHTKKAMKVHIEAHDVKVYRLTVVSD
jgi:alpha-galactosidase